MTAELPVAVGAELFTWLYGQIIADRSAAEESLLVKHGEISLEDAAQRYARWRGLAPEIDRALDAIADANAKLAVLTEHMPGDPVRGTCRACVLLAWPCRTVLLLASACARRDGWKPEWAAGFTCPCCRKSSNHADDIKFGYCGLCHFWTGDPHLGQGHFDAPCEHRTAFAGRPFLPDWTVRPGVLLRRAIQARELATEEFADRAGFDLGFAVRLLAGDERITVYSAAGIATALGTGMDMWLNAQDLHDADLARGAEDTSDHYHEGEQAHD